MRTWLVGLFTMVMAWFSGPPPALETKFSVPTPAPTVVQVQEVAKKPSYYSVDLPKQEFQTFNNCGPTTLSMILAYYHIDESAKVLGEKIRPYQVKNGDNDDKTVFAQEFVEWAKKYGLEAKYVPGGTIEELKELVGNNFPVVVKTLLHKNDDIAHFRIIKGWDEQKQQIIQDDSYEGKNKRISYFDFMTMWQPFEYGYIVVYPKDQDNKIQRIVKGTWEDLLTRSKAEEKLDSNNVWPVFNQVVANYNLGNYAQAVADYERVASRLPRRAMWYQIEPILAYQKQKNYAKVFELTDKILNDGNRAFSELYIIRGEIYMDQGEKDTAKTEFNLAIKYNKNVKIPTDGR